MSQINQILKEYGKGFLVHKAFPKYYEHVEKNIASLIELIENPKGIKIKYLKLDYHGVRFLKKAGFIEIKGKDYHKQILIPTEKLINFMKDFKEDDGYPFDNVNKALVKILIKELF